MQAPALALLDSADLSVSSMASLSQSDAAVLDAQIAAVFGGAANLAPCEGFLPFDSLDLRLDCNPAHCCADQPDPGLATYNRHLSHHDDLAQIVAEFVLSSTSRNLPC